MKFQDINQDSKSKVYDDFVVAFTDIVEKTRSSYPTNLYRTVNDTISSCSEDYLIKTLDDIFALFENKDLFNKFTNGSLIQKRKIIFQEFLKNDSKEEKNILAAITNMVTNIIQQTANNKDEYIDAIMNNNNIPRAK